MRGGDGRGRGEVDMIDRKCGDVQMILMKWYIWMFGMVWYVKSWYATDVDDERKERMKERNTR